MSVSVSESVSVFTWQDGKRPAESDDADRTSKAAINQLLQAKGGNQLLQAKG